jgi:signal transduction histidine kinase
VAAHGPLALRARLAGAGQAAAYVVAALALGLVHLVAVVPLALADRRTLWRLAGLERTLANRLLHARVPPLPATGMPPARVVGLLLLRLPAAAVACVAAGAVVAVAVELVRYGAEGVAGSSDRYLGPWALEPVLGLVLWVFALAAAIVAVALLDALRGPLRALVVGALAAAPLAAVAVREALAERIGDRSLTVAYWLPERSVFVDEHGGAVELPEPGSGRAWTAVEHEGRRVAAIVHDADLDARPELVRAAAAGAVLALDNERLKAELHARIAELRASRARIVEAGLHARRKIERDLHDGAQQHLVSLALTLRLLRNRVEDDPAAAALVDGATGQLTTALEELRELARGIHPAALADRGLPTALAAVFDRAAVPVESEVELEERLAPATEAAAYFVVAEALTNVAKYAHATYARVTVRRVEDVLEVEVADDGVGGARAEAGSGLRGLEDRVAAVDGTFELVSPPGEGTRVVARIPCTP